MRSACTAVPASFPRRRRPCPAQDAPQHSRRADSRTPDDGEMHDGARVEDQASVAVPRPGGFAVVRFGVGECSARTTSYAASPVVASAAKTRPRHRRVVLVYLGLSINMITFFKFRVRFQCLAVFIDLLKRVRIRTLNTAWIRGLGYAHSEYRVAAGKPLVSPDARRVVPRHPGTGTHRTRTDCTRGYPYRETTGRGGVGQTHKRRPKKHFNFYHPIIHV